MRTLLQIVQAAQQHVPAISRIHIRRGVGRAEVTISIARMTPRAPVGVHADGVRQIPKGPTRPSDAARIVDQNPPLKLHMMDRVADIIDVIDMATIGDQIAELDASGLVGRLNIEKTASGNTIISTHAATQSERDAWLMGLSR